MNGLRCILKLPGSQLICTSQLFYYNFVFLKFFKCLCILCFSDLICSDFLCFEKMFTFLPVTSSGLKLKHVHLRFLVFVLKQNLNVWETTKCTCRAKVMRRSKLTLKEWWEYKFSVSSFQLFLHRWMETFLEITIMVSSNKCQDWVLFFHHCLSLSLSLLTLVGVFVSNVCLAVVAGGWEVPHWGLCTAYRWSHRRK